jgi:hypothetical protein
MSKVFGNCCVQTEEMIGNEWGDRWKNVAIDIVIKHFEDKPKISVASKSQVLDGMFKIDDIDWDNDPDAEERYAYEVEERDRKLSAYFGTSKSDNDRLVNALFGADDKQS